MLLSLLDSKESWNFNQQAQVHHRKPHSECLIVDGSVRWANYWLHCFAEVRFGACAICEETTLEPFAF